MPTHLEELLARFDDGATLAKARTIPAAWYHDPEIAEHERRHVEREASCS